MYPEWFKIGKGVNNYLAVPDLPLDSAGTAYDLPGGTIMNGNIGGVHPFKTASDKDFRDAVSEDVAHAYYEGGKPLHPWSGETEPDFTGWDSEKKYSWVKAPRYNGAPMQVGPLAQVLVGDRSVGAFPEWFSGFDYRKVHELVPYPLIIYRCRALINTTTPAAGRALSALPTRQ